MVNTLQIYIGYRILSYAHQSSRFTLKLIEFLTFPTWKLKTKHYTSIQNPPNSVILVIAES